jgi:hydrocephalus-inducing protein
LKNVAGIEAHYQLGKCSNSIIGPKFSFNPTEGVLQIGEEQIIEVTFVPDSLGDFNASFQWDIKVKHQFHVSAVFTVFVQNAAAPVVVSFKGRMLGPTFEVDTQSLDFGIASVGFMHTKSFHITNTSEISMHYKLRIEPQSFEPGDFQQEFKVEPTSGRIPPFKQQEIQVHFTPASVHQIQASLVVDVDCVGTAVIGIPISADCAVPTVSVFPLRFTHKLFCVGYCCKCSSGLWGNLCWLLV